MASKKLEKFVESWFYDKFCKAEDCKDQNEFIDRIWRLYKYVNSDDVNACLDTAMETGVNAEHSREDIESLLSDYAHNVIYELWEADNLPDYYSDIYDLEV